MSTEQNDRPCPLNVTTMETILMWPPEGKSPQVIQNMKSYILMTERKETDCYVSSESISGWETNANINT